MKEKIAELKKALYELYNWPRGDAREKARKLLAKLKVPEVKHEV